MSHYEKKIEECFGFTDPNSRWFAAKIIEAIIQVGQIRHMEQFFSLSKLLLKISDEYYGKIWDLHWPEDKISIK